MRERGEVQVLMVRRQQSMRFLGGFWVFPGGTVDAAEAAGSEARDEDIIRAAAAAACRELVEEAGLSISQQALLHWAHWITPTALRRRFDTHFFVAPASEDQEPRVGLAESSELRWVRPDVWASDNDADAFPMTPPTRIVLRELSSALQEHGTVAALLERERNRPIRPVLPKLTDDGVVVLPWDPEYTTVNGGGIGWDARGIAERAAWPSRHKAEVRKDT